MRSTFRIGLIIIPVFIFFSQAAPCFGIVSGAISDAFGKPVAGARVTFTDEINSSKSYTAITDTNGKYQIGIPTSVNGNDETNTPEPFILSQNYPNPFNPSTIIPFTLSTGGDVSLSVYNIQGQKVRALADGYESAGNHFVKWNGEDDRGRKVSAGVYLYRMRVGNRTDTRKMLLLDGGGSTLSGNNPAGRAANDFQGGANKAASTTFTVIITCDDIVPYKESGFALADGAIKNFTVIRETVSQGITFVSIPGGTFVMGDEEWPESLVTVTVSPFQMSEAEITNAQYCNFLNDSKSNGQGYINTMGGAYTDNRCWITYSNNVFSVVPGHENWPVVYVSWYGAKAFAEFYGWDLPREAEWEYACTGGKQYIYGTDDGTIGKDKANYNWGSGYTYHPVNVKSYPNNPFGLYDMSGNVWEWCNDWMGTPPSNSPPLTDPTGPESLPVNAKIYHGGAYYCEEKPCRFYYAMGTDPSAGAISFIGFRVVRRLK